MKVPVLTDTLFDGAAVAGDEARAEVGDADLFADDEHVITEST